MLKRIMWKFILLEYAYAIHSKGSTSEKKSVKRFRHQKIQGKQEMNKLNAAKVNQRKKKAKDNRENWDNSFDVEIISGYIDIKVTEASLNLLQNLRQIHLLLLSPLPL